MMHKVPEARNIRIISRTSDFSVLAVFSSCRAASAFEEALKQAANDQGSGQRTDGLTDFQCGFRAGKRSSEKWFVAGLCVLAVLGPTAEHFVRALL